TVLALSAAADDVEDPLYEHAAALGYVNAEAQEAAGLEALEEAAAEGDQEAAQFLADLEAEAAGWTPEQEFQMRASMEQLVETLGRGPPPAEKELMSRDMLARGDYDAVTAFANAVGTLGTTPEGAPIPGRDKSYAAARTQLAHEVANDSYDRSARSKMAE